MSLGHGASVVRNGLILHLDAANKKSYSGSGTTWTDLSGNGNNFTLFNSPTHDGKKLTFNGTNQYAECVNTTCGNFGSSGITLEYCVGVTSVPSSGSLIMKRNAITSIGAQDAKGWAHRSNVSFFTQDNNPGGNRSNAIELSSPAVDNFSGISYNVMRFTRSGLNSTIDFYINNTLKGTISRTLIGDGDISNSWATTIFWTRGENVYTSGDVYFVKIYNRTLTVQEIQQNFNALRGRYGV